MKHHHLFGLVILAFLCLLLSNCGSDTSKQIQGHWVAHLLMEEKDTLKLPSNDVHLTFSANNSYSYNGTLRYKEAGTYRTEGRIIYTTDTLNQQQEKAVHIEQLKGDTLILNMVEHRKPRRMELHRN